MYTTCVHIFVCTGTWESDNTLFSLCLHERVLCSLNRLLRPTHHILQYLVVLSLVHQSLSPEEQRPARLRRGVWYGSATAGSWFSCQGQVCRISKPRCPGEPNTQRAIFKIIKSKIYCGKQILLLEGKNVVRSKVQI